MLNNPLVLLYVQALLKDSKGFAGPVASGNDVRKSVLSNLPLKYLKQKEAPHCVTQQEPRASCDRDWPISLFRHLGTRGVELLPHCNVLTGLVSL